MGETLDDFDLLTRLGRGAFATVFLARQQSMQRLVALKVSADRGNEPQTMALLDHPHIVRVFDQRRLPDRRIRLLYMQYVPGGTLQSVVDAIKRLPPSMRTGVRLLEVIDQALSERGESPPTDSPLRDRLATASWPQVVCWLGSRLAVALAYAHQRGVLHRDVKPANVLLTADGTPKLADFNISYCSKVEGASAAAYFGGSLAYMSPEQLEACNPAHERDADDLDARSDIYSLGVLLWELLTGSRPFPDCPPSSDWTRTLATMLDARRSGVAAEQVAQLPRDCPPGLKQILLGCLAEDRDKRWRSAAQLSRQLELALEPQVMRLLRPRPGAWRNWVRRYPLAAMFAACLAPNVVFSVLNIAYNIPAIFESLGKSVYDVLTDPAVIVINAVAFSLGIAVLLPLTWPVARAVAHLSRRTARGRPLAALAATLATAGRLHGGRQCRRMARDGSRLSHLAPSRGAGGQIPRWPGLHALHGLPGALWFDGVDPGLLLRVVFGRACLLSDIVPDRPDRSRGTRHRARHAAAYLDLSRAGGNRPTFGNDRHGACIDDGTRRDRDADLDIRHSGRGGTGELGPGICVVAHRAKRS